MQMINTMCGGCGETLSPLVVSDDLLCLDCLLQLSGLAPSWCAVASPSTPAVSYQQTRIKHQMSVAEAAVVSLMIAGPPLEA